jgi:cytochrome P450
MPTESGKTQCPYADRTFHGRPGSADSVKSSSLIPDAQHFDHADHFDIHRACNPHLSFGRGQHIFLGTTFSKSEIEAALRAMLKHVSPEHWQFENLGWSLSIGHRWPLGLKVNLSV